MILRPMQGWHYALRRREKDSVAALYDKYGRAVYSAVLAFLLRQLKINPSVQSLAETNGQFEDAIIRDQDDHVTGRIQNR
ncbi:hypothetical protein [Edaphobacter aggregans]|uniref:hypothetical protein n=1 Tax=Edaphobacter aggregans TaxID=570835 RepID=UPI001B8041C6|nr:hypothetical protein [Edaphobacter aggregans]